MSRRAPKHYQMSQAYAASLLVARSEQRDSLLRRAELYMHKTQGHQTLTYGRKGATLRTMDGDWFRHIYVREATVPGSHRLLQ